jgi:hypothetical protein
MASALSIRAAWSDEIVISLAVAARPMLKSKPGLYE